MPVAYPDLSKTHLPFRGAGLAVKTSQLQKWGGRGTQPGLCAPPSAHSTFQDRSRDHSAFPRAEERDQKELQNCSTGAALGGTLNLMAIGWKGYGKSGHGEGRAM